MRIFGIAAVVVVASGAVVLLCIPVAHIDQSTCDQIRPGMTVGEAEAIIGASPGWYDGVWGIRTNSPGYKGYKPHWVGNQGEIILDLDEQDRVARAQFYPGHVLHQSISTLVGERLTRSAFGTGRTDLVIEVSKGALLGLLMAGSLVLVALLWRGQGLAVCAYGLCVLGAILSLGVLILTIGIVSGTASKLAYFLLGGGSSGLVSFAVGVVLTRRPRRTDASGHKIGALLP
jgi:hypothetical protein